MRDNTKKNLLQLLKRLTAELHRDFVATGHIDLALVDYIDDTIQNLKNNIIKGKI